MFNNYFEICLQSREQNTRALNRSDNSSHQKLSVTHPIPGCKHLTMSCNLKHALQYAKLKAGNPVFPFLIILGGTVEDIRRCKRLEVGIWDHPFNAMGAATPSAAAFHDSVFFQPGLDKSTRANHKVGPWLSTSPPTKSIHIQSHELYSN